MNLKYLVFFIIDNHPVIQLTHIFVHAIITNIIVDMKWFDPSLRDGNYFQLKYLSYSVMK